LTRYEGDWRFQFEIKTKSVTSHKTQEKKAIYLTSTCNPPKNFWLASVAMSHEGRGIEATVYIFKITRVVNKKIINFKLDYEHCVL